MRVFIVSALASLLATTPLRMQAQSVQAPVKVGSSPFVAVENGIYTQCGMRVAWTMDSGPSGIDAYAVTVEVVSQANKSLVLVFANSQKVDISRSPPAYGGNIAPADLSFGIEAVKAPVSIKDRKLMENGVLGAAVNESTGKVPGNNGSSLISAFLFGEPVLLFWRVSADEQHVFRIKTEPKSEDAATVKSCLSGMH